MKSKRNSSPPHSYQTLEQRQLLAGDVTVSLSGSTLSVQGDVDANQILIVGQADGSAIVTGLQDTTINGGTTGFTVDAGLGTLQINLEEGNDEVEIRGLVLERSLTVRTGDGDDRTLIENSNVRGFEFSGDDGNDVMEFDNVFSRSSITINGGDGDDTIAIGAVAGTQNGLIDTGDGDDSLVIDNLGIRENLSLQLGDGDDQALIAGETYGRRGNIVLGEGNDNLSILPAINDASARFRRSLTISGNNGDDTIALDANVTSSRRTRIDGDAGNDSIEEGSADLERSRIRSFEATEIVDLNGQLDAFYTAIAADGIDVSRFGGTTTDIDIAPVLTVSTTALLRDRDGDPISIDDALTLTGDDNEIVTSASVVIAGFQTGQEALIFSDTADIQGSFDSGTLTLTGDADLDDYQTALRSVTYDITSIAPSTADRTLEFTINLADTTLSSLTASRDVSVTAVEELNVSVSDLEVAGTDGTEIDPLEIDPLLQLRGNTETEISDATVVIENFQSSDDVLLFTNIGSITGDVITDDTNNTATLTLTGEGTVGQYQLALRSVTFQTTSDTTFSTRTAVFTVTTDEGELTGSRTINVLEIDSNAVPALTVSAAPAIVNVANVDDDDIVAPVSLSSGADPITITDVDGDQLSQAIVAIDEGRVEGDVLTFTPQDGIVGSFDSDTGVLTLAGEASIADYETVLQSIEFGVAGVGSIGQRNVSIEITDVPDQQAAAATAVEEIRVDVVSTTTARITTSNNNLVLAEDDGQTIIDDNLLVVATDDGDNIVSSATVQLSEGYQQGEDELGFVALRRTSFDDPIINGSFDAATGTLTLTGDAPASTYQDALQNVYYENATGERTAVNREVIYTVNSNTAISDTRTIALGDFSRFDREQSVLAQFETENGLSDDVQITDSGLHFIVETTGNGVFPTATDTVRVNYLGTFLDGTEFDSAQDISFSLQQVIEGWTEGFQSFDQGSTGVLLIPSHLAYSGLGVEGIPPYEILIFEIELLEINP